MNEQIISTLKPKVQRMAREMVTKMKQAGYDILITSGLRTYEEQDKLYAQGRTTPGAIVTNAKGGQSFHNFGVAFDCVPLIDGKPNWNSPYTLTSKIGKECGLEWGGDWATFPDKPHFQWTGGYTLKDFQEKKVMEDKFL